MVVDDRVGEVVAHLRFLLGRGRFGAMDECAETASELEADARTRTGDPFITSEVLYQLSYVGARLLGLDAAS